MTRTELYAAVVTLLAAAPTLGGETSPGRDVDAESAIPAQEVRDVVPSEGEAVSRQARARRAPSQRAGGEDGSSERGAQSSQSTDGDQRATDDSLRQQQIWTAP